MIAVDTNVLIRFLVRDDAKQAARAATLIRGDEIWISKTVLLETEWVLRSLYAFPPERVAQALQGLAGLQNVLLEDELKVAKALDSLEGSLDFADALHLVSAQHAARFATFDHKCARQARPLTTLEIVAL
jgi:predicted nucleic-acid-binding protein